MKLVAKVFNSRDSSRNTDVYINLLVIGFALNQGCGKRFKRESELDAHLLNHQMTKFKCDQCTYENADPCNVCAHKRKHSEMKSFVCKGCGKAFTWVQQCR